MKTSRLGTLALAAAALWELQTASAQVVDFSGEWRPLYHEDMPERVPGPEIGDFAGLPINDAARLRGESYDPDRISVVTENICRQHGADYSMRGLANLRIRSELDPVTQEAVAFHSRIGFHSMDRTIYLDGRPPPPEFAPHTWQGFSTGKWIANQLEIRTTHLKESYIRRNGLPASADRTLTERWVRHGNILTVVMIVEDPAFLTERLVRSENWILDPGQRVTSDPCEYVTEVPSEPGAVPHYLPGQNLFLNEWADHYGLPRRAARGGAETMYPEFRLIMGKPETTPERCRTMCQPVWP